MKKILFIHGSSDLYGSSKMLLLAVQAVKKDGVEPFVLLPYKETLDEELKSSGARVFIGPIAVLRRQNWNPKGVVMFFLDLIKSISFIKRLDKKENFSAIYSNTSAVISGAVYAKLFRKKHIWHVHEIIKKPRLLNYLLPRTVNIFSGMCIANSQATKRYLLSGSTRETKIKVIYNGVGKLRNSGKRITIGKDKINIGMIGRINRIKGQEVFVKAAYKIIKEGHDARFLIAGSYFMNEKAYLDQLKDLINELCLKNKVEIFDFVEDLASLYSDLDIIVMPTKQPESFGLVAAEAMSMKKPVVASNVGGLPEVVADGETGILFEPGNDEKLKDAMLRLIKDSDLRKKMGEAGFKKQKSSFTEDRFKTEVKDALSGFLK